MEPGIPEGDWREDCAARTEMRQRRVLGISKKMLMQIPREMEANGLPTRHVQSSVPGAVEYRLAQLGNRVVEVIEPVHA